MEIRSDDGARVRIRPVGYQPGVEPPDDPDEAAGCGSRPRRPAIRRSLWRWRASPSRTWPSAARVLRRRRLALTVEFSYESLPPWMRRQPLSAVYPLTLTVSADALAVAAEQWARETEAYPRRATAC